MDSVRSDCCEDGIDIGYAKLVDRHINKYERIFDENERKLNRYKPIEEVITHNDSEDGIEEQSEENQYKHTELGTNTDNNVEQRNSDCIAVKSGSNETEKQQQTTSSKNEETSIYTDLYKPTHVYTCYWCTCRYETSDYKLLEHHLYNEHIKTQLYVNYSRSFVQLNVYQYKCLHCDYQTKIHDTILSHICNHNQWKCVVNACDKRFATKDELSLHEKQLHESQKWACDECGRRFATKIQMTRHTKRHKPWKCFTKYCGQMFVTKEELTSHKKQHNFVSSNSKQDNNTAPRPYSCQYRECGRSFRTKHHLTVHQRCHKRVWKCFVTQCGERFMTRKQLMAHNKLHYCVIKLNSKEYLKSVGVCGFCNISRFFEKRKVVDACDRSFMDYLYCCVWSACGFETYCYNTIQRHIHDTHTCPYK